MVFSSIIFLFLFLPVVLVVYYALTTPARLFSRRIGIKVGNILLFASSLFFYTWGEKWFVLVMLFSTLVDYCCGLIISGGWKRTGAPIEQLERGGQRRGAQKAALVASIVTNLSVLGFFKYFNFGMDNVFAFADLVGWEWLKWNDVIQVTLPLGISFYTFQSLSYTIDVYRGETRATRDVIDFCCFVTFFPQLVAGPIVRYRDIAAQLVSRVVTQDGFAYGVSRFIIGLGKKVLVANTVAVAADGIFAIPDQHLTCELAWLGILCYTLQIYFDFSGYSDMAIGLGRMFGFTFLENFNYPYIARSVRDFWRRWHMSLSRWFRDYLYIPLGGNRASMKRIYFNLVMVFFLCGLWHGASWTFVVWGLYHGLFLVVERVGFERWTSRLPRALQHLYVLMVAICGWVLFRSETFSQAMNFFQAMAGAGEGTGKVYYMAQYLEPDLLLAMAAGVLFSAPVIPWLSRMYDQHLAGRTLEALGHLGKLLVLSALLIASILSLSSGTHNPFIYFRF
ncbi:MAG: MBOAT family O-acyltransferase [Planctomycetota bacterium]